MWSFKFKFIKFNWIENFQVSITLATFQGLKSHLVASNHHPGQCWWRTLPSPRKVLLNGVVQKQGRKVGFGRQGGESLTLSSLHSSRRTCCHLVLPHLSVLNLMHTCVRRRTLTAADAQARLTKVTIMVSFGRPHRKATPQAQLCWPDLACWSVISNGWLRTTSSLLYRHNMHAVAPTTKPRLIKRPQKWIIFCGTLDVAECKLVKQ